MSSRKPTGLVTGERFTGTMTRLSNSTSISWDVLQYGVPPVINSPNATFSIIRPLPNGPRATGQEDFVAPFPTTLRATSFSGFVVSEPTDDTNIYDETQDRITVVWDFDDPGYVRRFTPNIPTAWLDTNKATGVQVSHVFTAPGSYTVLAAAFDDAGNWGLASYTFGTVGDAPAIENPDTYFPGVRTICYDPSGDFTNKPTGAAEATSWDQVRTQLTTNEGNGFSKSRVLFRRGRTYTDSSYGVNRDGCKGIHIDVYGSGTLPAVWSRGTNTGRIFEPPDRTGQRSIVIANIDIEGEWDAATETGIAGGTMWFWTWHAPVLLHRFRVNGCGISVDGQWDSTSSDRRLFVLHDCEITNWNNYGVGLVEGGIAVIGCDLHQHEDALNGCFTSTGNPNPYFLGNKHGPLRLSECYDVFISCSSIFSRNGWSNTSTTSGISQAPTAEQGCIRWNTGGGDLRRGRHVMERCSLEGGWTGPLWGSNSANTATNTKNLLLDKVLIALGPQGNGTINSSLVSAGFTMRNCLVIAPNNLVSTFNGTNLNFVTYGFAGTVDPVKNGPVKIYNCTFIDYRTRAITSSYTGFNISANFTSRITENNVIRVPNSTTTTNFGSSFEPLSTSSVAGFTFRHKGQRWNFQPIGSLGTGRTQYTVGSFSGGVDVPNGGSITVPYSVANWTGLNNGEGFQLTQALAQANSTQFHQVSVNGVLTQMSPGAAGGNGQISVTFNASDVTITNSSGVTWPAANGICILFDLSDYLMDFVTGTSSVGTTAPISTPLANSSALTTASGTVAQYDAFDVVRNGKRLITGEFKTGLPSQGWVEPT